MSGLIAVSLSLLVVLSHGTWALATRAYDDDDDLTVCESPSPTLEPFVDELTFPAILSLPDHQNQLTLGAFKITQKLHRDLPNTTLYAFGTSLQTASFPGPTLLAVVGVAAQIRWENEIEDAQHMLGTDNAIPWASPTNGGVPIVVHLHGGEVQSNSDGHPEAWFTAGDNPDRGPTYATQNYTYPNLQRPSFLWYHDHTHGITRLNLFAGLMGMYLLVHDQSAAAAAASSSSSPMAAATQKMQGYPKYGEGGRLQKKLCCGTESMDSTVARRTHEMDDGIRNLNINEEGELPIGLPLLIRDWRFSENGSLSFSLYGTMGNTTRWCAEYGDLIVVNGVITPYLRVLPRLYRFRLLNACNARCLELSLTHPSLSFLQIGSDGGTFLPDVRNLTSLLFSPGERLDVLIDFTAMEDGAEVVVLNTGPAPFPSGKLAYSTNGTFYVMKFVVDSTDGIADGVVDVADGEGGGFRRGGRSLAAAAADSDSASLDGSRRSIPAAHVKRSSSAAENTDTAAKAAAASVRHRSDAGGRRSDSYLAEVSNSVVSAAALRLPCDEVTAALINDVGDANLTVRRFTMRSFQGKHGEPNHLVLNNLSWSDPVTDFPKVGSTEVWELINLGADAHNMHIHLVSFRLLNTQSFAWVEYEEEKCAYDVPYPDDHSCFTEEATVPEGYGNGWKDTILAWPGNVTRLLIRFASNNLLETDHSRSKKRGDGGAAAADLDPFPFDATTGPGYLWHCHTGDHEDYEMMRPFRLRSSDDEFEEDDDDHL